MCRQKTCSLRTLLWKHILPSGLDVLNLTITRKAQSYGNLSDLEECGQTKIRKCAEKYLTGSPRGKKEVKGWKAGKAKLEPLVERNFVFGSQKASHGAAPKKGIYQKRQKDTNDQNFGFYVLATISCCLHRVPPMNNDFLKEPLFYQNTFDRATLVSVWPCVFYSP